MAKICKKDPRACEGRAFSALIMYNDLRADTDHAIQQRRLVMRQIHAAVRTVRQVDVPAEALAPRRVVQADRTVREAHPVIHPDVPGRTDQALTGHHGLDRVKARRRRISVRHIAGHARTHEHADPVQIVNDGLCRQVDVHIGLRHPRRAEERILLFLCRGCLRRLLHQRRLIKLLLERVGLEELLLREVRRFCYGRICKHADANNQRKDARKQALSLFHNDPLFSEIKCSHYSIFSGKGKREISPIAVNSFHGPYDILRTTATRFVRENSMVINHNLTAMNANRQFHIVTDAKQKSAEKLSGGYRINHAADDAAGLSISEKLHYQIRGLEKGADNTLDGISLLQVADGALNEVHDILHRMTELSVQAANDTNTPEDRNALQNEINALCEEIDRISDTTEFNTRPLFDGSCQATVLRTPPTEISSADALQQLRSGNFALATKDIAYRGVTYKKDYLNAYMARQSANSIYWGMPEDNLRYDGPDGANTTELLNRLKLVAKDDLLIEDGYLVAGQVTSEQYTHATTDVSALLHSADSIKRMST